MTRKIAVLTVAALLALAVAGCSAGGPGPEDTVEKALAAIGAMDVEQSALFFTEDTRPYVISGLKFALERIDEIEISAVETRVVSEEEGTATVEAEYSLRTVSSDRTRSDQVVKTVDLVEVNGEWLIADLSLIE